MLFASAAPLQCSLTPSVVPLYLPLGPVRMIAVQSTIARIFKTHQPPQFPWQPRGPVPRVITTKSRALRIRCEFGTSLDAKQQQQQQQQQQHLTRQLHVGSFSLGFGPVHFSEPQFCPFHQLIPPSICIRTTNSSIIRYTRSLAAIHHITAGTPASGKVSIPGLSQTRL